MLAYALIIGMDFIVAKLSDKFNKKVLKVESEKEEFDKFLDENFLNAFYFNNCNDAFNGEIFIDEM